MKHNKLLIPFLLLVLSGCQNTSSSEESLLLSSEESLVSSSSIEESSQSSETSEMSSIIEESSSSSEEESSESIDLSSESSSWTSPITEYLLNVSNAPKLSSKATNFQERLSYYESKTLLFTFNNVSPLKNGFITINEGGSIRNNSKLDGFTSITIDYVGDGLSLNYGISTPKANKIQQVESNQKVQLLDSYNYFELVCSSEVDINSIKFEVSFDAHSNYSYCEVYDADYNCVVVKEGEIGSSFNTSELPVLDKKYYEDKEISFLGYAIEDSQEVITSFEFTKSSKGLYPVYENYQKFSFDHDFENHTYTSNRKGVRLVSEVSQERYGRFSADFQIDNQSCTSADIIFNAKLGPDSYPYELGDGTTYYAFHINPNSGGFQFACDFVGNVSGWNVLASASLSTNKAWNKKWNAWNGSRATSLCFNLKAEFTPNAILLYIDDGLLMTYTKPEGLNLLEDKGVGIRANTSGVTVSNFAFSTFVEESNGFLRFGDGSYVSYLSNVSTVINKKGGTYGLYTSKLTVSTTATNSRSGILARASHQGPDSSWVSTWGYYVHHNVTANVNFTLSTIAENTYQGLIGDASHGANIGGKAYTATDSIAELKAYYSRNNSFYSNYNDSTFSYVIGLSLSQDSVSIYLDDAEIFSSTSSSVLSYFINEGYNGLGILAGTPGLRFENMRWTSYEK